MAADSSQKWILMTTAQTPTNIAVIKYWGKRDEGLILAVNDSISVTLDPQHLCTTTTVAVSPMFQSDRMWLNGKEISLSGGRYQNCLREIRSRASKIEDEKKGIKITKKDWEKLHVHIASYNNFPTAAGLASSAAGFACLVFSLAKLMNVQEDQGKLSAIARQGSGSACRSYTEPKPVMSSIPSTQQAIVLPAKRTPFAFQTVPVYPPAPGEVLVRVAWTSSTPLDLHRADGGLLISEYPQQMGSGGAAGRVVAVGDGGDLKGLSVGDRVVSFAFHGGKEANHQEYITIPAYLASRIPDNISYQEAVTVSVNLVTVFHTATADLKLELPWPVPQGYTPKQAHDPILIWGASSSVGIYAVQVFRHWGFKNIIAVASEKQHAYLRSIGATETFDYRKQDVVDRILQFISNRTEPKLPYIIDCIGSLEGTLKPLSKIAQRGSTVAVMLPVILKDATLEEEPEYEMDVSKVLVGQWADGVEVRGVRTHFYLSNEFLKEKAQPEMVPKLLKDGVITPNKYRVVEGSSAVERAQKALDILRNKGVSGERLVWRITQDEV